MLLVRLYVLYESTIPLKVQGATHRLTPAYHLNILLHGWDMYQTESPQAHRKDLTLLAL